MVEIEKVVGYRVSSGGCRQDLIVLSGPYTEVRTGDVW